MTIPHLPGDSSAAFLADGYLFGHRRFERLGTDAFRTRLLGRRVTVLRGLPAVHAFYAGDRFTRQGAVPRSVVHSLQDVGSVQTLSGAEHHQRKALFLGLLDDAGRRELADAFLDRWDLAWRAASADGERPVDIRLMSAESLTDATLSWLGIPESAERRNALAAQCLAMIDGAGSFGPRNWIGRTRRLAAERWAARVVDRAAHASRSGEAWADAPVHVLAARLAAHGTAVAARELLNLVRPTVAVSNFIVFATLALHRHPQWRQRIAGDPQQARAFAQEVRRTTPFFPAVGGIALEPVTLQDVAIEVGDWVLVDLFATDRHPGQWRDAWTFDPSRFVHGAQNPVAQTPVARAPVAQGAGDPATTHHCPGEPATVDILAAAIERLARAEWSLQPGDHGVDLRRLPARPASPVRVSITA